MGHGVSFNQAAKLLLLNFILFQFANAWWIIPAVIFVIFLLEDIELLFGAPLAVH